MDLSTVTTVYKFVQDHWQTVTAVATFVTGVGGAAMGVALKDKAYQKFFMLALSLVEEVAVTELDGPEKRKWVADTAYDMSPLWVKKLVSEDQLEQIVEHAYQTFKENK